MKVVFGVAQTLCMIGAACIIAGCGGREVATVKGKVSFQGEPLASGAIRLDPIEGTEGPSGRSKIVNGEYQIGPDQALVPGKYRVAITAVKKTGRKVSAPEVLEGEPAEIEEEVQYIPERYNVASELQITLQAGENTKDFNLE